MNHHIDVFGQLSLVASNGIEIRVHADKDIVSIVLPNSRAARQLLGQVFQRHERRQILKNMQHGLQLSNLKMYFKIAHFQVAQLTPQSQGGLMSRWLGLAPLKLHPLAVLRAIVSF